jgi:hypothetical protein
MPGVWRWRGTQVARLPPSTPTEGAIGTLSLIGVYVEQPIADKPELDSENTLQYILLFLFGPLTNAMRPASPFAASGGKPDDLLTFFRLHLV